VLRCIVLGCSRYMPPDPPPQFLPEPLRNPLNLDINWTAVEQQYFDSDPGVLVVDNFLTAEAVENIRRLCLESTLFWDVRSRFVAAVARHRRRFHQSLAVCLLIT